MAQIYAFQGIRPVVDPTAFVHPAAILIGDVIIGPGAYIAPGASLRGDYGRIVIGEGANIQDNCVMHGSSFMDCAVEKDGHIGHGAILHTCVIREGALVGMNAVVMDEVEIGKEAIVAAMAFVRAGDKVPARTLVAGIPAKPIRDVTDDMIGHKMEGTRQYHENARRPPGELEPCEPLAEIEPGRGKIAWAHDAKPL